jgi:hypothetical protein
VEHGVLGAAMRRTRDDDRTGADATEFVAHRQRVAIVSRPGNRGRVVPRRPFRWRARHAHRGAFLLNIGPVLDRLRSFEFSLTGAKATLDGLVAGGEADLASGDVQEVNAALSGE